HKLPHKTCEKIFGDFECLLEVVLDRHAEQIKQACSVTGDPTNSHEVFDSDIPRCLFNKPRSSYQREQFARKNFLYAKAEGCLLANPGTSPFQYVSIGQVIQNLFQVPDLAEHLLQPTHSAEYRANLSNIHLTLMATYQDVEKEGLKNVLQSLLHDLSQLKDHGLQVQCSRGTVTVKATVVEVCGDNLSLHKLGGFSCSFSNGRVCHFCMARKEKLAELIREDLCTLRNSAAHQRQLSAMAVNAALKTNYGVTGPSPMLPLKDFGVTKQLMPDVMHDMFEGGFAVPLHQVLKGLNLEGTLTFYDFNSVAQFKVGFNDKKKKPEGLPSNFAKDQRALKSTASQK
ncbi:hypothetical protein HPB47_002071, partial [Ixodes persulcatus]